MSDYLCEELIIEIFTRLPVKSLIRFRSLSKSLRSCISTPHFIRMHTFRSPKKILFRNMLRAREYDTKYIYTLYSEDQLHTSFIRLNNGVTAVEFPYDTSFVSVGSCDGILCMVDFMDRISLWNPSIRRKLTLPHCPCSQRGNNGVEIGFVFDPITDDYKIVCLPKYGRYRDSSYVYTTKTRAWCVIASPTPSFYQAKSRGYFVGGVLHWLVECDSDGFDHDHVYILTFNLNTHVFGMISLPDPSAVTIQLTIIQGSLTVISTKSDDDDSWIWVMKEYGNAASWYVFCKPKTNQVHGQLHRVLQLTNGDLLFNTFESRMNFKVYDPKTGAVSRVHNLDNNFYISYVEMCVESLHLFNMGWAC